MKKWIIYLVAAISPAIAFGQAATSEHKYFPGYFLDNEGKRTYGEIGIPFHPNGQISFNAIKLEGVRFKEGEIAFFPVTVANHNGFAFYSDSLKDTLRFVKAKNIYPIANLTAGYCFEQVVLEGPVKLLKDQMESTQPTGAITTATRYFVKKEADYVRLKNNRKVKAELSALFKDHAEITVEVQEGKVTLANIEETVKRYNEWKQKAQMQAEGQ